MSSPKVSRPRIYVYILKKPDGTPFYVGVGRGRRIEAHERDARCSTEKTHKLNVIRKIWRDGGAVVRVFDSYHHTNESATAQERDLIQSIGRCDLGTGPLTNQTDGGEGFFNLSADSVAQCLAKSAATRRTPAIREKNSEKQKRWHAEHPAASSRTAARVIEGSKRWQEEFPLLVAAAKAKRAAAQRRPDVIAKRVASLTKFRQQNPEREGERLRKFAETRNDPAVVAKRNAKAAESRRTPEYRAASREFQRKWRAENPAVEAARIAKLVAFAKSDENRRRVSDQAKAMAADPEIRRKRAEAMKARWADPEYKARVSVKISAAQRNPEVTAKRIASLRKYREANPEAEARRIAGLLAHNRRGKKDETGTTKQPPF
jgi:hypothetical protein